MTGMTRQERAAATRQRLVEAAVRKFAGRPYNEVAVSDIAEEAGVAHGVVFHHFGNKRGVYLAAVEEISQRLFDLEIPGPLSPPGDQVRSLLRDQFSRASDNAELLVGYVRGSLAMAADPQAWESLERTRMRMVAWACSVVGLDQGNEALRLMLRAAGDTMDQVSLRWVQQEDGFAIDDVIEAMIQVMIGALRAAKVLDPALDVESAVGLLG